MSPFESVADTSQSKADQREYRHRSWLRRSRDCQVRCRRRIVCFTNIYSARAKLQDFARQNSPAYFEPRSALKLSSASSPPIWLRDDKTLSEHSRNVRLTGSETLAGKCYSSVATQNVHVIGRLPHLDGANDSQRVSALSLLSKAASPVASGPGPAIEEVNSIGKFDQKSL
jgi:hypothetical protein